MAEYELAIAVGLVMLLQIDVGVSIGQSGDLTTAIALIGAAVVIIIGVPLAIHLVGRPAAYRGRSRMAYCATVTLHDAQGESFTCALSRSATVGMTR